MPLPLPLTSNRYYGSVAAGVTAAAAAAGAGAGVGAGAGAGVAGTARCAGSSGRRGAIAAYPRHLIEVLDNKVLLCKYLREHNLDTGGGGGGVDRGDGGGGDGGGGSGGGGSGESVASKEAKVVTRTDITKVAPRCSVPTTFVSVKEMEAYFYFHNKHQKTASIHAPALAPASPSASPPMGARTTRGAAPAAAAAAAAAAAPSPSVADAGAAISSSRNTAANASASVSGALEPLLFLKTSMMEVRAYGRSIYC